MIIDWKAVGWFMLGAAFTESRPAWSFAWLAISILALLLGVRGKIGAAPGGKG